MARYTDGAADKDRILAAAERSAVSLRERRETAQTAPANSSRNFVILLYRHPGRLHDFGQFARAVGVQGAGQERLDLTGSTLDCSARVLTS